MLADVEDLDDVGVLELGDGLGLGQEAGGGLAAGVPAGQDHLQGDGAVESDLAGPVDDPHAAAAQLALDPVAGDDRHGLRGRVGVDPGGERRVLGVDRGGGTFGPEDPIEGGPSRTGCAGKRCPDRLGTALRPGAHHERPGLGSLGPIRLSIPSFWIVHRGSPGREAGVGAHAPEGRQPDERTLRLLAPASKGLTGDAGDWPPGRADRGTKLEHPIRIPMLLSECVLWGRRVAVEPAATAGC